MMDLATIADFSFRIGSLAPQGFVAYLRSFPPPLLERLRQMGFQRTLRLASRKSPFYREKFARQGIQVRKARKPQDLEGFYVTPDEVRRSPEAFLCDRADLAIESSGTTGHAVQIYLSHRELDYNARQSILFKAIYGITREDRILSTFDYGFCLDGQLVQRALPHWKSFSMCVGRAEPIDVYNRLPLYRFNVIMSGTPWLARLTEVAASQGRPFPLKLLVGGGGGGISRKTRGRIEAFWEAPLCMTYGSAETATVIGFECLRREGYHLNEFDFFVEILDPDREGFGEVVITTVHREVMPMIRYRTRDVARLIPEPCPCGLPLRRLSALRGRLDEIVASVWGNVHPDFFEKILDPIPGLADDWQVALREEDEKQVFQFRLEVLREDSGRDEIKAAILSAIERRHPLAWQAQLQNLSAADFVFFPKGSLRKGRKLLRLVDERGQQD